MSAFDIILGLPLLWAAYRGFRDGIAAQLGGIIGLLLGIFLAFRFAVTVGSWFGLESTVGQVVGFLVIVVVALVALSLLGRITRGLFRFAGLGALDSIGGILLGVVKMGLLLSVLLIAFDALNRQQNWVAEEDTSKSILYKPVKNIAGVVFPYVDFVKNKLL